MIHGPSNIQFKYQQSHEIKEDMVEEIRHTHGQMEIGNHIFVGKTDGKRSFANLEVK